MKNKFEEYDQTKERLKQIERDSKLHQDKVKMWSKQMRQKSINAQKFNRLLKNLYYDSDEFID